MIYKILALTDKNTDIAFDYANRILKAIESKFEREFRFDNVGFAENNKSVIEKAKASDAVLIFGDINKLLIRELCKELSLHTRVCRIGDSTVVTDELSGIYSGEQGFRSNPKFGREAYDTECYSELEIERTARIAYELQNIRSFILADKADELATSKLWRKIVTDINEDYPYINVELQYVENTVAELAENNITGTILTPQIFSDILINIIKAKSQRQGFTRRYCPRRFSYDKCKRRAANSPAMSGNAMRRRIYATSLLRYAKRGGLYKSRACKSSSIRRGLCRKSFIYNISLCKQHHPLGYSVAIILRNYFLFFSI